MKTSIVISVPHSGTNFVKERMNAQLAIHTWIDWHVLYKHAQEADHIYVPMRNPVDVHETWIRRSRMRFWRDIEEWYCAWYNLNAIVHLFDCDIIYVDKQEDPRIKDWGKVGSLPKARPDHWQEITIERLWELPIVRDHYPRPPR